MTTETTKSVYPSRTPIERYDLFATTFEDSTGLNRFGFNAEGMHSETGTSIDPKGFDFTGWSEDGWHFTGWSKENINRDTGTAYDKRGYDINGIDAEGLSRGGVDSEGFNRAGLDNNGFDRNGVHSVTGTHYNQHGLDADGYDERGFEGDYDNATHGQHSWNRFSERDYLRSIGSMNTWNADIPLHKATGTIYAPDGFNFFGFDADGYDRAGFDRIGEDGTHIGYNRDGYNPKGFDVNGYNKQGFSAHGYDRAGFNAEGKHVITGTVWSPEGIHAVTRTSFDEQGYSIDGEDKSGYDSTGYNRKGFNADRIHKVTGTHYDSNGRTEGGLNARGFHMNGNDGFDYCDGEKAPSRVYTLSPWNRNIIADKLRIEDTDYYNGTPRNLYREGWRHIPGQGFDAEKGIYIIAETFTHKDTGSSLNPEGFNVLGLDEAGTMNERGFDLTTGIHVANGTMFDEQGWNLNRTELVSL
jgi:hypothetical protein